MCKMAVEVYKAPEKPQEESDINKLAKIASIGSSIYSIASKAGASDAPKPAIEDNPLSRRLNTMRSHAT